MSYFEIFNFRVRNYSPKILLFPIAFLVLITIFIVDDNYYSSNILNETLIKKKTNFNTSSKTQFSKIIILKQDKIKFKRDLCQWEYNFDNKSIVKSQNHCIDTLSLIPDFKHHSYLLRYKNISQSIHYLFDPPTNSMRNEFVIVYLAQQSRVILLSQALAFLFKNYNDQFKHKIIIFYNGKFNTVLARSKIAMKLNLSQLNLIEFHEVSDYNSYPINFDENIERNDQLLARAEYPSYQQMCSFYHFKIMKHPRMKHVKYFMRQDTDSFILSKIEYNLYDFLERNNVSYAYRSRQYDNWGKYSYNFVYDYISRNLDWNEVTPRIKWLYNVKCIDDINKYTIDELVDKFLIPNCTQICACSVQNIRAKYETYYNNWEIVNIERFAIPKIWKFLYTFWSDPLYFGMYRLRWGDDLARAFAVNIFPELYNNLHFFCDIHYHHAVAHPASCDFTLHSKSIHPINRKFRLEVFNRLIKNVSLPWLGGIDGVINPYA